MVGVGYPAHIRLCVGVDDPSLHWCVMIMDIGLLTYLGFCVVVLLGLGMSYPGGANKTVKVLLVAGICSGVVLMLPGLYKMAMWMWNTWLLAWSTVI